MKKGRIILIVIVLLIIGGVVFFRSQPKVFEVTSVELETRTVRSTVSASGEVTSINEADLALPAVGQLQHLAVEKGALVENNSLIGNVYNYDSSQSAQALKDSRDVAKQDVTIYTENYGTNYNAVGGEDEYNLNLRRLNELLSKAEASYQSALGTLTKTYLYAPFKGTIIDVYTEVGEVVTAGAPIVKIADLENLIFEISVDQEDFGQIQVGQKVEVSLDSYESDTFYGTVSELPQYADDSTEEFLIKIELEQSEGKPILLGMNGDASIIIEEVEDADALTFDVVYQENGGHFIWIVVDDLLVKENVEIGLEGDVYTVIKSDITGKEIIIPVEENGFEEGGKVKYGE